MFEIEGFYGIESFSPTLFKNLLFFLAFNFIIFKCSVYPNELNRQTTFTRIFYTMSLMCGKACNENQTNFLFSLKKKKGLYFAEKKVQV